MIPHVIGCGEKKNVPGFFIWCFSVFFNKGLFSFCDTSFLYVQFFFLCFQGIYTVTELWVKGRGQDSVQQNWTCELRNIGRHLKLFMNIFPVKSQVHCLFQFHTYFWRICDSPSDPFCRCCCWESYKGCKKPCLWSLHLHAFFKALCVFGTMSNW